MKGKVVASQVVLIKVDVQEFVDNTYPTDHCYKREAALAAAVKLARWCDKGYTNCVFAELRKYVGKSIEEHDPRDDPYHPDNWADPRDI